MANWRRDPDGARDEDERSETPTATTEEEWRKTLSAEQFYVCRMKGTEPPFSGKYDANKADGSYRLRGLRQRALQLGHQVRFGDRLAQLLGSRRETAGRHGDGRQLRDEESRGPVPRLRVPPGTRLR